MRELQTCDYDYVPHECDHPEVDPDALLYGADPDCEHEIKLRHSGYGCIKCSGWYCA